VSEFQRLIQWRGRGALVVGVLADGETSFHVRRGDQDQVDERTLFEIGSITKPFTGALLAEMCLRGEVAMDDPVSKHLPDSELPRWRERPPTLEELATHRADLPNAPSGLGRKEMALALGLRSTDPWAGVDRAAYHAAVRHTAARRAPGGRFRYSSLGFALLGDALSARAGAPYGDLLRDRIGAPLALADTAVDPPPALRQRLVGGHSRRGRPRPPLRDQMAAAGAIRASAGDLLRFLAASLSPPDAPPGPALALAAAPRVTINKRMALGLGWMVLRRKDKPEIVCHNGGTWGFRSFAAMIPRSRAAVVVLTNSARSVDRLGMKLVDAAG
jgi:CubicO group peptidase (beta-lactamase class C family)